MRKIVALILSVVAALTLTGCYGSTESADELRFRNKINYVRGQHGLHALNHDEALAKHARDHVQWMANNNSLTHSDLTPLWSTTSFTRVGENIGKGACSADPEDWPQRMVEAWMNSQLHRDNILDGRYTHVGHGVTSRPDGTCWVASVFGG